MKLDSRYFSQKAHGALTELRNSLSEGDRKKASSLVQGLSPYIATWGLHRLAGDRQKFSKKRAEDTTYKGLVYAAFLDNLSQLSPTTFNPSDESTLLHLPLRRYTALNHLAMRLAQEWSFWAVAVLGEGE
ncbi:MAG: hypothetical protein F6K04_17865 [Leptolyngbya sp. SIO4C5]|nr:hypothetical protein [Leptolyngbya sp. SIO4C5]